jgi:hypothetical protein
VIPFVVMKKKEGHLMHNKNKLLGHAASIEVSFMPFTFFMEQGQYWNHLYQAERSNHRNFTCDNLNKPHRTYPAMLESLTSPNGSDSFDTGGESCLLGME